MALSLDTNKGNSPTDSVVSKGKTCTTCNTAHGELGTTPFPHYMNVTANPSMVSPALDPAGDDAGDKS